MSNLISEEPVSLDVAEKIGHMYKVHGHGDSAHAFQSIFMWQKDVPSVLLHNDEIYTVKIKDDEKNIYYFPCGTKNGKIDFLQDVAKDKNAEIAYATSQDTEFLNQYVPGLYDIELDESSSEYLYGTETLSKIEGKSCAQIRREKKDFLNEHDVEIKELTTENAQDAFYIYEQWLSNRQSEETLLDIWSHQIGISNLNDLKLYGEIAYENKQPLFYYLGFYLDNSFDICMSKSIVDGAGKYILHCAANMVKDKADYINFEEDLGINGLRTFKRRLHPIQMLDMYRAYPVQAA